MVRLRSQGPVSPVSSTPYGLELDNHVGRYGHHNMTLRSYFSVPIIVRSLFNCALNEKEVNVAKKCIRKKKKPINLAKQPKPRCIHLQNRGRGGRVPKICKQCLELESNSGEYIVPLPTVKKPRCIHMQNRVRGRPPKICKHCLELESNSKENILPTDMDEQTEKTIQNASNVSVKSVHSPDGEGELGAININIVGPGSNIFESREKADSLGTSEVFVVTVPSVLFPYEKDESTPGNLKILDDYNTMDGVMMVPLARTREFDSHLDNIDPVVSDLTLSNLMGQKPSPSVESEMAINNSYPFVQYLQEQSSDIINIMSNVVPLPSENNSLSEVSDSSFDNHLKICIAQVSDSDVSAIYTVARSSAIHNIITEYCETLLKCPKSDFRFFYKKRLIKDDDTADSLNMEEGDTVRCYDAKILEVYMSYLVPYMQRHKLSALPGSLIEELIKLSSPSFPGSLKLIVNVKNEKMATEKPKFLSSLTTDELNDGMRILNFDRKYPLSKFKK